MTLNNAKVGTSYTVENMDLKIDIKRHLEAIGMILNTTIEVLNKKRNGSVRNSDTWTCDRHWWRYSPGHNHGGIATGRISES